ncbi:MAG: mechanosensitive ion channel family protein [marine benthic group bacterium]|nr:mechanosensitive ion channel family protein [Candidatus Carthagonibacter metallireducens]MCL7967882.1 mechanosensitive ion channel family protein [Gemmatimonadota bacterium]MCL7982373.1 mechanosensitive ion channel family protein [Gemmatimonadota bacterium]MCL7984016.1 mechanosensitive ion channel family protein [Gemmatimonadota bacterium]MCL7991094.1 mechanosensitive ion channel family protein [Gemmatimonadota bacterium]
MEFLDNVIFGNPLRAWTASLAIFLGLALLYALVKKALLSRIVALSEKTQTGLDDSFAAAINATKSWLLLFIAIQFAVRPLSLSSQADAWLTRLAIGAALVQVGFWASAWVQVLLRSWQVRRWGDDPEASMTVRFVGWAISVAVWAIVAMLVLENLGVDISALVAGLGIGGIAVALAVQSVLGDLLASLSILLDKPFVIGDYLSVDDLGGTVESIGLNSTRLTSLTGEQLVFSNKDLLQSRIRNYGRMEERRVLFKIGVVYGTPPELVEKIPEMLRSAIESHELTRFSRSHFKEFGDSALIFETVYFMTVPDYGTYMDVQQAVNIEMLRRFAAEGIEFAYPTQHLYVESLETVHSAGPSAERASGGGHTVRTDSVDDPGR